MPRNGAITFVDLIGKLDLLRVACNKCGRDGCYGLNRLIEHRGCNAKLIDGSMKSPPTVQRNTQAI